MSTVLQGQAFLGRADESESFSDARFSFHSVRTTFGEGVEPVIRYAPSARKTSRSERKSQSRVLRRISGFLTEMNGKDARVAFVENGEVILYDMPAEQLRRSGIEIANQPFQMDEIEMQTDDGLVVGYRFQPLAKASDAYIETLNFDEERKRKRDLILKKFAKATA